MPGLAHAHPDPATEALEARVAELEARLSRIESVPVPAPVPTVGRDVVVPEDEHWREAVAWNSDVVVNGAVSGPVVAVGGDIIVGPEARVDGRVVSMGGTISVHPAAVVTGDRVGIEAPHPGGFALADIARRLAGMLFVGALVVCAAQFFPDRTRNVADHVIRHPFWLTVGGAIVAMGALVGGSTALATVVGAPLGLLIFAGAALAWLAGTAGIARALGEALPGPERSPWVSALAGAVVWGGVSALPWVGPAIAVGGTLLALGAGVVSRLGRRATADI